MIFQNQKAKVFQMVLLLHIIFFQKICGTKKINIENPNKLCFFYSIASLGKKPHFSTMFSTTSQLSFIVENISFNCKMLFVTQK
jgi:hypothetical protein